MHSLYIDTHNEDIVIALFTDEKLQKVKKITEKLDHSRLCMPTIISLLKECRLNVHQLSDIVVINGPGSFTGERLGVTIAKTFAYCLNIPIRTITSLEICLASINLSKDTYLVLEEKNGYYIAEFTNTKKLQSDYTYLKKSEYSTFSQNHYTHICNEYDLEKVINYAHQKDQ